jgi:hypothetical protein
LFLFRCLRRNDVLGSEARRTAPATGTLGGLGLRKRKRADEIGLLGARLLDRVANACSNAAAKRFGVSIASAVRWVPCFKTKGEISPAPTGGDRRSGRIEARRDYLLGLVHRRPDMTLLEIQERLIGSCGERFSFSVLWRFFDGFAGIAG